MICRPHDQGWLMISQPAHAWMAGKLAAAWGNEQFATPSPREAVILATRLHDIGWLDWDTRPRLGKDGRPVNFLGTNLEETIPIWKQAVQWVQIMNPFAALLVSMHASTIYGRRLERGADPPEKQAKVAQVLQEHEQFQTELRLKLAWHPIYGQTSEPDQVAITYRWLRICDLLSLAVLAKVLPKEGQFERVPVDSSGRFISINYRYKSPLTLEVSPWPFARPDVQLLVEARYLDQVSFDNQLAYHSALKNAAWHSLSVTLRPSS